MKYLEKIGIFILFLGFAGAFIHTYIAKTLVAMDIIYLLLIFVGSFLQFIPCLNKLRTEKQYDLQDRKYFLGIVTTMLVSLVSEILCIKFFYL